MAEAKALRRLYSKGDIQVWEWDGVTASSAPDAISVNFTDATAQVIGEFGGAGVCFDVSLDGENFGPLARPMGESSIVKTSTVISIKGPVPYLRPRLVDATDETKLRIRMAAVQ